MNPSLHELMGITIMVGDPLWVTQRRPHILTLTDTIESYSHKNSAFLGFDNARITITVTMDEIEEWWEDGLGRHIEVHGDGLDLSWEGFADIVEIIIGGETIPRGPLMDLTTQTLALYAPVDYSTNPPTIGERTPTTIVLDQDAQDRYGVIEKVLSVGQITQTEAEQIRDTYLNEHKEPDTSNDVNYTGDASPQVVLTCLGYGHLLNNYFYNQTAVSSSITVSDKIKAVLDDDPNGIFSIDQTFISDNGLLSSAYESDYPKAMTVIKELVALGDVNDNRYLFQVLDERTANYFAQPTTIEYLRSVINNTIEDGSGEEIDPWDIRAGKWMQEVDFFPGKANEPVLRNDLRNIFIEGVDFTAPFEFSIQGVKIDSIPQLLAKLGMGGVSA